MSANANGAARAQGAAATCKLEPVYVGLDLGDKTSAYCMVTRKSGRTVRRGKVETHQTGMRHWLSQFAATTVILEAGTHSPWVSELITACGHEAVVLDPRQNRLTAASYGKNDRIDAETLARLYRGDRKLLKKVYHRGPQARYDLALLRARDACVRSRTLLINCARNLVKSSGGRLPKCSAESFPTQAAAAVPEGLQAAVLPLMVQVNELTVQIRDYEKQISRLCQERYPETAYLQQIKGVGELTALAYVLTLERHERFQHSRDVGAYLGLKPKQHQSGNRDPQLRITKTGDRLLRRLMVGAAHYILRCSSPACNLKSHGERIAARGGKNAKKRAVVAVARKLSVLLHRLWKSGAVYQPFYPSQVNPAAVHAMMAS